MAQLQHELPRRRQQGCRLERRAARWGEAVGLVVDRQHAPAQSRPERHALGTTAGQHDERKAGVLQLGSRCERQETALRGAHDRDALGRHAGLAQPPHLLGQPGRETRAALLGAHLRDHLEAAPGEGLQDRVVLVAAEVGAGGVAPLQLEDAAVDVEQPAPRLVGHGRHVRVDVAVRGALLASRHLACQGLGAREGRLQRARRAVARDDERVTRVALSQRRDGRGPLGGIGLAHVALAGRGRLHQAAAGQDPRAGEGHHHVVQGVAGAGVEDLEAARVDEHALPGAQRRVGHRRALGTGLFGRQVEAQRSHPAPPQRADPAGAVVVGVGHDRVAHTAQPSRGEVEQRLRLRVVPGRVDQQHAAARERREQAVRLDAVRGARRHVQPEATLQRPHAHAWRQRLLARRRGRRRGRARAGQQDQRHGEHASQKHGSSGRSSPLSRLHRAPAAAETCALPPVPGLR